MRTSDSRRASIAARIGEVSGVRVGGIDIANWTWTARRQTTPSPGGPVDKGTKGKRAEGPADRRSAGAGDGSCGGRRLRPIGAALRRPSGRTHHHGR